MGLQVTLPTPSDWDLLNARLDSIEMKIEDLPSLVIERPRTKEYVAGMLDCDVRTLERYMREPGFPVFYLGKSPRFLPSMIVEYLKTKGKK